MDIKKVTKPILKWVGGKTQILNEILDKFPKNINNYHEIFLGGGSVLFGILSKIKKGDIKLYGTIFAYDVNEPLIHLYKNIQENHEQLYIELNTIINEFNICGKSDKKTLNRKPSNLDEAIKNEENYYYWTRQKYNSLSKKDKNTIIGSAYFIFLNKTCFRGVFRVGPNGFNVPFGNYKKPEIINKTHLQEVAELIKDVVFTCSDFNESLSQDFNKDDFIYLDPPYVPENKTSFVKYTENGFNLDNHIELFNILNSFKKNVSFMMSNSDVKLVHDSFSNDDYSIDILLCKRSINSKNPDSKTNEVIVKN
jgi:DNA adenine methylase